MSIIEDQGAFFATGQTRSIDFRISQLKKLKEALKSHEQELLSALKSDLNKSAFEAYGSEIGFLHEEINFAISHLRSWAKPKKVSTPILYQLGTSWIYPQPRGVVLIIGAWNYPVQLILGPLIAALAAGNCAVLKPSEISEATGSVIASLIQKTFDPKVCTVVSGGVEETTKLLKHPFDHIFFTGSTAVGRIVMQAAAEHLTPVTLELGGKSPCVVDAETDLEVTARRIAWGKFYNAGQTCVAPDYLLVQKSIKPALLAGIKRNIDNFFSSNPAQSPDYGRIVNDRHFVRLKNLASDGRVILGGTSDAASRCIAPTMLEDVSLNHPVMQEEIFGPILPVIEYDCFDDALNMIEALPNPLASYLFTHNRSLAERFIEEVPFGGGCINNALIHLANPHLPFGGIGTSGMGAYHGKAGFDCFSHMKTVVKSSFKFDLKIKYPPYKNRFGLLKLLMR